MLFAALFTAVSVFVVSLSFVYRRKAIGEGVKIRVVALHTQMSVQLKMVLNVWLNSEIASRLTL